MYIDWRCVDVIDDIDCFYVYWLKMCRCYRWYRLFLGFDVSYINVLIDGMNKNENEKKMLHILSHQSELHYNNIWWSVHKKLLTV
jgi:hypothetical protein